MCTIFDASWAQDVDEKLVAPAVEEDAGEEITIEEERSDEVERLKVAPDPGQPTLKQLELHRITHIPFRTWCKWCVMARARGAQHSASGECTIAIIGMDYFFITRGGIKKRSELEYPEDEPGNAAMEAAREGGEIIKCIVIRCSKSKVIFAHVVPCKGVDEDDFVANTVVEDLAWFGYTSMIIKADNEAALQALVRRVVERVSAECKMLDQVTKEEPAKYDSQSNGLVEVGVLLVRGLFRTLKLCLEDRIGRFIPVDHALVPWMLEHACLILNTTAVGPDGLTGWARVRGRAFGQRLVGYAEKVLYELPMKGPNSQPDGNMGTRWKEGIFLGHSKSANVYVLADIGGAGIVRARSLHRRPEQERWSAEDLANVRATPWSEREIHEATATFKEPAEETGADTELARPAGPRKLRINKSDLDTHGYTDGCSQCEYVKRHGRARPGAYHSERCRRRITEAIQQTAAGRARIETHEERLTRATAAAGERIMQREAEAAGRSGLEKREELTGAPAGARAEQRPAINESPRPLSGEGMAHQRLQGSQGHDGSGSDARGGAVQPEAERRVPRAAAGARGSTGHSDDGDNTTEAPGMPTPMDSPMEEDDLSSSTSPPSPPEDVDASGDQNMGFVGSLEPSYDDFISELMLQQIGSSGRSYARERRQAVGKIVSEIYSPPRITKEIRQGKWRHLIPGFAFDFTVNDPEDGKPWDFGLASKRERARKLLREQKPYMLIGSPACKAFSTWMALNAAKSKDPQAIARAKTAAGVHMSFVISLYHEQLEGGRYFLHEHPLYASSWALPAMEELSDVPGVRRVHGDQCQFGAEAARGRTRGQPIKKPSGFLTNSQRVADSLERRCRGVGGLCSRPKGGRHQACAGRHARDAQVYPKGLCRAVLKGVTDQMRDDNMLKEGCYGIQVADDDAEVLKSMYGPEQGYSGKYRDDLTGQVLRDDLVKKARAVELAYFNSKGVWKKVPRGRARTETRRPPVSVRWVDVNKGDEMTPNYRSRLVARQMKVMDQSGQSFFAPAPPLEALRTVLSLAMTAIGDHKPDWDPNSGNRTQVSFVDVKRAYFNAVIDPRDKPTFVDLPAEDGDHLTMCAQLLRHMYGTRGAADGWQEEYSTMLVRHGFRQGNACPNLFFHPARDIVCSVHGDDFTSSGPKPQLDWLETVIAREYEITIGPRIGPGANDAKEGRALNRVVRWCSGCIEYEADPRQAERLIAECGLEGAKSVATPGVKATFRELEEDAGLRKELHTAFRGAAARGNYLVADRIDGQFACKEICRYMANPTAHAWRALKRLCRYFSGAPRLVYEFKQQSVGCIDTYTDTDWAGCPRTRKSTSGGVVMLGQHTMKHWSSTQTSTALSSGEAEFAGVIRGAGQGLGYQSLLKDLGITAPLRVWTDSSAAIGICSRQGLGKMRHLDTHTLWIQQAVRSGRVDLRKILGEENPADLLTKHSLSRTKLEYLVSLFGCRHLDGRAASAPLLRRGNTTKVTMAEAAKEIGAIDDDEAPTVTDVNVPVMPHVQLSAKELEEVYPKLVAPPDEQLEDFVQDDRDMVYQHGLSIAGKIQQEVEEQGRRRHVSAETRSKKQAATNSTVSSRSTTTISSICRRRSAKRRYPVEPSGVLGIAILSATSSQRPEAAGPNPASQN